MSAAFKKKRAGRKGVRRVSRERGYAEDAVREA